MASPMHYHFTHWAACTATLAALKLHLPTIPLKALTSEWTASDQLWWFAALFWVSHLMAPHLRSACWAQRQWWQDSIFLEFSNFSMDKEKEWHIKFQHFHTLSYTDLMTKLLALDLTAMTEKVLIVCHSHVANADDLNTMGLTNSKSVSEVWNQYSCQYHQSQYHKAPYYCQYPTLIW